MVSAASSSLFAIRLRDHSSLFRFRFLWLSARLAFARATDALATVRFAFDSSSFALRTSGSMSAMSCPFFTWSLKSA
ncbi:MAG: hypothetical protein BWY99_02606 [Synergistetes bacterium ADurb.BinA166]|nr:MAG: hypothetical protein BWY99_02606 [Synergistetes bacterium ADurb.BinA166]